MRRFDSGGHQMRASPWPSGSDGDLTVSWVSTQCERPLS